MNGPSLHLSWAELACKDGTPYPDEWKNTRAVRLSVAFEALRKRCGAKPIYVSSGYRTPEWNRRVGGAKNSQHCQGLALDLLKPQGLPFIDFCRIAIEEAEDGKLIRGIGIYTTWLHIDCRDTSRLARWHGSRVAPEVLEGVNG